MTLHRAENVDKKEILSPIIKAIIDSKQDFIFPIHPRTLKRLHDFNLYTKLKRSKNIRVLDPVGYFEVLELMKNCQFILTDSGGIQEEATAPSIRKKVVVVRKTTDRPESISTGFSEIAGTSYKGILRAIKNNSKNPGVPSRKSPFGSGNTTKLIIKHLKANI